MSNVTDSWVSVTDRLPDEGEDVIITFINSAGTHAAQAFFKDFGFYYEAEGHQEVFPIVTYWMPMPKPKIKP